MTVHRDVDRADELRHALECYELRHAVRFYERTVHRRRAQTARTAALSLHGPSRHARRSALARPAVVAGLVLVVSVAVAVAVVSPPAEGEPVVDLTPNPSAPQRQFQSSLVRVVVDPGHGGHDPGARADELKEAALVLDVATRLETRLTEETRIEVVLTRRDDVYLSLRARTELANRVNADLFLSIHANASRDRLVGGIATYHLIGGANPISQVAAREHSVARSDADQLPHPVRSTARNDTPGGSRALAELVQRNLIRGIRELHPEARDLGVKEERFEVLIGANMPGVLTEVSFLSNQEEAALLATDAYLDRISDALFQSIVEYQSTLTPSLGVAEPRPSLGLSRGPLPPPELFGRGYELRLARVARPK